MPVSRIRSQPAATTQVSLRHMETMRAEPGHISDVLGQSGGRTLILDRKSDRVLTLDANGRARKLDLPGRDESELGSAALGQDPRTLWTLSADGRELAQYSLQGNPPETAQLQQRRRLGERIKKPEAMVELAHSVPGERRLAILQEEDPRKLRLLTLTANGGERVVDTEIEPQVGDLVQRFSALAVTPGNRLLLGSRKSEVVSEVVLDERGGKTTARLVRSVPLRGGGKEGVDGLGIAQNGELLVRRGDELQRFGWR